MNVSGRIAKILKSDNAFRFVRILINLASDKDQAVRKVLYVLAANQSIPLARKDELRKSIRNWFKHAVGDRYFFACSDLHRPHKRKFLQHA